MKRRAVLTATFITAAMFVGCDAPSYRSIAPTNATTDPASTATTLPPSVHIALPADSVLTGDTLVVTATAFDFSGKPQRQASISWATHAVDPKPGVVSIVGVNQKAQQITLRGVLRGKLMLIASYTDRWGQTATDSAAFHVAPRTATVGICQIAKRVADSLGISGDTTMDWSIVGPFCLPDTATVWPVVPGADTTKAYPSPNRVPFGMAFLDAKARVHIVRQ